MLIFAPKPTKTHHISPIFRALAQKKKPILGLIIRCLATRAVTPPDNPMFADGILKGLMARYESIHGQPFDMENKEFSFELTDKKVKSKLITIKANTPYESRVRGYLCSFRMKAPLELMKIAYEGGVGEQCSQGFGFIKNIEL